MGALAFLAAGVVLGLVCARSAAATVDDWRRADSRWQELSGVTTPHRWWHLRGRVQWALVNGAALLTVAKLARHRLRQSVTVSSKATVC